MGQTGLFDYNDKHIDGVLGTRTLGGRMEGANKSTEEWQHPCIEKMFMEGTSPSSNKTRDDVIDYLGN